MTLETVKLKVRYGFDSVATDYGFFWPGSEEKRQEALSVRRNSPAEFESVYQQRPGAREGSVFLKDDLCYYRPPRGLELGIRMPTINKFCSPAHEIVQAWDTAFTETHGSAWTVCITGMLLPCNRFHRGEDPDKLGECEFHFDILILDVYRDRLDWGGLVRAVKSLNELWLPHHVIVEKKATGISLIQALGSTIHIVGVDVPEGKRARATMIQGTGAGSVQGWYRQHRVVHPRWAPWLQLFETELKDFSGANDATSDQVDAAVHLVNYGIQLGSKTTLLPSGWEPERDTPPEVQEMMKSTNQVEPDPRAVMLTLIADLPNLSSNPFEATCSNCSHFQDRQWCEVWQRHVTPFDVCERMTPKEGDPLAIGGGYVRRGFGATTV